MFLMILVVGFVYEWKKGALDWECPPTPPREAPFGARTLTRSSP
jgi:hypothetical protein